MQHGQRRDLDVRIASRRSSMARAAALAVLLGASLLWAPAHADWPLPRADVTRTGATAGTSDLAAPVPYWRYYLGGAITARGAMVIDVDGDGAGEVVLVSGGKLTAKDQRNRTVWETPVLGISTIAGSGDLDGDGTREILAHNRNQVFVVDTASGRIRWQEPADDFGFLGGARVGDIDGDGIDDLFVQECGCCRINNGNTGFIYRFAGGYDAAERLWTLPSVRCSGNRSMAIGDIDGNGRPDVTLGENRRILVLDGATGAELAATADLGERVGESQCIPVDIDVGADANTGADTGNGHELVCFQSNSPLQEPALGHRVLVLRYRPGAGGDGDGQLELVWQRDVGALNSRVSIGAAPVVDIDGDGALEIVAAGMDAGGTTWTTYVFDAATGAVRGEVAGERIAGVIGAHVLTARDEDLRAWALGPGGLEARWTLPGQRLLIEPDWQAAARISAFDRVLAMDVTGDGAAELFTAAAGQGVLIHDLANAAPREVSRHALGTAGNATVAVLAAWTAPATQTAAGAPTQLLVATSDGIMRLIDRDRLGGAPDDGVYRRGLRFGGYFPRGDWRNLHITPVTGDLGTGADSVIISDSQGTLLRLDAGDASLAAPPVARWAVPDTTGPILLGPRAPDGAGGDAAPFEAIACRQQTPDGDHAVAVLDVDGGLRWRAALPGIVLSDIVPARLDSDHLPDLVVQWGRRSDAVLEHRAFDGATGTVQWDAVPQQKGSSRFPAGGAVVDWNGDGADDFVHMHYDVQVLSGADGAVLAESTGKQLIYFMPTVLELDDDAAPELVLHGGFYPARAVDDDLSTPLWVSEEDDRPYPYGAVATGCADGVPRLVEGSLVRASTLKITPLTGPDAGAYRAVVLAGGTVHADEDQARAAGAVPGQLTSTSLHADLTGDGRPIAVVGSEDGWLYAVDACAGDLVFAVPFGAAVGAIAFGDTNGDGRDELLAAVDDGYLYALAQPPVGAPATVVDLDPAGDGGDADVDIIGAGDRMAAMWAAVPEADAYQVAVVHERTGRIVSEPAWQDVGAATRATVTGLPLTEGDQYIFAIRALKQGAPSPDAMSDGVVIEPAASAPDSPGSMLVGGCDCRGANPGGPGTWLLAAGILLVLRRRRARHGHATRPARR